MGDQCERTNGFLSQYNNNSVIKNNNIHDYFINGNSANGIIVTTAVCLIARSVIQFIPNIRQEPHHHFRRINERYFDYAVKRF